MTPKRLFALLGALALAAVPLGLPAQTSASADLSWNTVDGGGGTSTNGTISLTGSIGQPDARTLSNGGTQLVGGFLAFSTVPLGVAQFTGYDGPGGVGSRDGSSNLTLWMSADANVTADGSGNVTNWADRSGRGHDAAQSTTAAQPDFVASGPNGQPTIDFALSEFMQTAPILGSDLFSDNQLTAFFAINQATGAVWFKWQSESANRVGFERQGTASRFDFVNDTTGRLNGVANIIGVDHVVSGLKTPTDQFLYVDGTQDATRANALSLNTAASSAVALGANTGGGFSWQGEMAEAIIFDRALNSAERILVENYLGAKYNIPVANDVYGGDGLGFDFEVAGIGREADGTNAGGSGGGMIVEDVSFLQDDGDYWVFGHDGSSAANTTADIPVGIASRWGREFYVENTDANTTPRALGGMINLAFDFSEAGRGDLPAPGGYSVLYRADNTPGTLFTALANSVTIAGDVVAFNNLDTLALVDGFYTLGTATLPLAVELESFTATTPNRFSPVAARWTTSAEIDVLGFDVYRAVRPEEHLRSANEWLIGETPLNPVLLPGRGTPSRGADYLFMDGQWTMGEERAYFLIDIDLSGRETIHGPAFVRYIDPAQTQGEVETLDDAPESADPLPTPGDTRR